MASSPDNAQLQALMQRGELGQALAMAQARVDQHPGDEFSNLILGRIRLMQGLYDEADAAAGRVLEATPDHAPALLLRVSVLAARGRTQEALAVCDHVDRVDPGTEACLLKRAELLERAGSPAEAIALLRQAPNLDGNVVAAIILARGLITTGQPAEAVPVIDGCLGSWSQASVASPPQQSRLLHLRAKAHDAMGVYDQAFADATAAKTPVLQPFNRDAYLAEVDQIIKTFTPEVMQARPEFTASAARHVFIAGMPRSGTTLAEQILDAHPEVTGVGEAKEIHVLVTQLQQRLNAWIPWPGCAGGLTGPQRQEFSREYEGAMEAGGHDPGTMLVNKHLLNIRFLGLIAMLFPGAKVVFCRRDPRDTGISCFMANMSPRVTPELQRVDDIAFAIQQADRLLDHWKRTLPLEWMEVRYEEVVMDHDRQSRNLIDFCGLPWDDRCLSFFSSGRTVMTLSYDQVNRPIYSTSVGRYRNYESHIPSLMSL